MNLRDHTLAWLDSIGADGLMPSNSVKRECVSVDDALATYFDSSFFIPSFLHNDGIYHAEPECCLGCTLPSFEHCKAMNLCDHHKQWLAHKEATK